MTTAYQNQADGDSENQRVLSREESNRDPAFAEPYDALDLRLIDTFPASDAIAQY